MATTPTLASLIQSYTTAQIFTKWISILQSLGVSTDSWQTGDPTRETGYAFSEILAAFEDPDVGFPATIAGGLLGLAAGPWLSLLGAQNFNTTRNFATFAESSVTLTNETSSDFGDFEIGDVTLEDSETKATYRNLTAFSLGPNATATFDVAADIAGTVSNAGIGEIDTINTPGMPGVTCTNTTVAIAIDDEADDKYTERCQEKFGSVSPAGPRDAYDYAIKTPSLQTDASNTSNVTRTLPLEESDFGDAIIFIAGAGGALSSDDVTRAQDTIEKWANPFVVGAEMISASNVVIPVTYQLWLYDSINLTDSQIEAVVAAALAKAFEDRDIGGDKLTPGSSGYIYVDWIKAIIIEAVAPYAFKCTVSLPVADQILLVVYNSTTPTSSSAQVAVLGTIIPTITQVEE
jgi:hypothetical protein